MRIEMGMGMEMEVKMGMGMGYLRGVDGNRKTKVHITSTRDRGVNLNPIRTCHEFTTCLRLEVRTR